MYEVLLFSPFAKNACKKKPKKFKGFLPKII